MIFALLCSFISLVLDVLATVGIAADEKDLEIALLRQQLRVLDRKDKGKHRFALPEKLILVTVAGKLKMKDHALHQRLRACLVLAQPETLLNGTATWYGASGPFASPTKAGDRGSMPSWKR